ncbi:MAG: hypothetical protein ALAOOOJD_04673 [bacterium]|nr:hypothetical protein [bacterium]
MKKEEKFPWFLLAANLIYFCGCTSNPFGGDKISAGKLTMSGTVRLADQADAKDIWIWMNGFNLSTVTKANGEFTLSLPPKSAQSGGGISGIYTVYFYMANYLLDSAQVVVQNGEFVYARGDLTRDGRLAATKSLRRFLEMSTVVSPATVRQNFIFRIGIATTLRALIDSCTVIFPGSIGDLLGAIFFRNTATGEVIVFQSVPGAVTRDIELIGRMPTDRVTAFTLGQFVLPPGQYEVIPQILVRHQTLPPGLIESMGSNVEATGSSYLKIPFRRTNGKFELMP